MDEQMIDKAERAIHERRMLGPWNDRDLAAAAHSVMAGKVAELEGGWRCFHCNEVFTDRKLAEDHFGQTTLHPAACVDPLRDNEKAMRERAMFYERAWREALQQRDDARAITRRNA